MQKRYIKINAGEISKTSEVLIKDHGLPSLVDRLNLYLFNDKGKELQVKFRNSKIFFKENSLSDTFGWTELKNRSVKSFLQTLDHLGFNKLIHGRSQTLEFNIFGGLVLSIFKDSLKGPFLEFEYSTKESERYILSLIEKIRFEDNFIYDTESFNKIPFLTELSTEVLFNQAGRLNKIIKDYCINHGVEIRTDSLTLGSRLEGASNDYSEIEDAFKIFTSIPLVDGEVSGSWNSSYMDGVSIIIPSYNSYEKLEYTLRSINSQELTSGEFRKVEVIVVDDNSQKDILSLIEKLRLDLKFECKSIRFSQNLDVSFARNAGASVAQFDNFIFLDSDILISKNYIKNMLFRLKLIPNAVFTSFRKNILSSDEILKTIDLGLNNPVDIDDSRISNKTKSEQVGWADYNSEVRHFHIFDDTNGFKNLGFGASVGVYDLPGILSGHNIVISRTNFFNAKGFDTKFKGWGMEDKFFGLSIVLQGNFIIPVVSAMVYHLDYGPRDGDMSKKIREVKANYEIYKKRLGDIWV
ncbi:MAG: glycosyltransferase [Patescibacteria group bacterium]